MAATEATGAGREDAMTRAAGLLAAAQRVVVFTGAGVSAESGIATFRGSSDSLWAGITGKIGLALFGTPLGWRMAPRKGWALFLKEFYAPIAAAAPNAAHRAIAELPQALPGVDVTVITQNVDGLHQRAGSDPARVFEVHGTVRRFVCVAHGHPVDVDESTLLLPDQPAPVCTAPGCTSTLRPDAVLFTEPLPAAAWLGSVQACRQLRPGDVLLVVGTSGTVQPAASLPQYAAAAGAHIISCNLQPTDVDVALPHPDAQEKILLQGPAGTVVPELVARARALRDGAAERRGPPPAQL